MAIPRIPDAYTSARPAVSAYPEGIVAVWKPSGNSTRLWWSVAQVQGSFGLIWDVKGVLRGEAQSELSPALLAIPGSNHLICAWKSVGPASTIFFSKFNGSYWSVSKEVIGSITQSPPSLAYFGGAAYLGWNGIDAALYLARFDVASQSFDVLTSHDGFQLASGPAIAAGRFSSFPAGNHSQLLYAAFTVFDKRIIVAAFDGASWRSDFTVKNGYSETDVSMCTATDGVCIAWKGLNDEYPAAATDPGASCQVIWHATVNSAEEHFPQQAEGVYSNYSPSMFWDDQATGDGVIAAWQMVYPLHPVAIAPLSRRGLRQFAGQYRPGLYGTVPAAAPSIYKAAQKPHDFNPSADWQTGVYAFNARGELWAHRESNNGPYDSKLLAAGIDLPYSPLVALGTPTTNSVSLASFCNRSGGLQWFHQNAADEWTQDEQRYSSIPPGANIGQPLRNSPVLGDPTSLFCVDASGALVAVGSGSGSFTTSGFAPPGAPVAVGYRVSQVGDYQINGPMTLFLVGNDEALWAFDIDNGTSMQLPGYVALLPGSYVACGYQTGEYQQGLATSDDTGQSQLDVFVIDRYGQMQTWWESQGSPWTMRAMEPRGGGLEPGGPIAIGGQLWGKINGTADRHGDFTYEADQLDVLTMDTAGVLRNWFVYQSTNWDEIGISTPSRYESGSHICTTAQSIDDGGFEGIASGNGAPHQLTLFIVDRDGRIQIHWVFDDGTWQSAPAPTL